MPGASRWWPARSIRCHVGAGYSTIEYCKQRRDVRHVFFGAACDRARARQSSDACEVATEDGFTAAGGFDFRTIE